MRLKIIAGNLIAVLVIGLVSFFVVKSQLVSGLTSQIDTSIRNDQTLFDRSWRLSGVEFVEHVRGRAQTRNVRSVFSALDTDSRRERAFDAAEQVSRWFRNPARGREGAPDIVAITDETGKVIARDTDINRLHGRSLVGDLPTLRQTLRDATSRHDVWYRADEAKLLQTGISPIRNDDGALVGALVVGYDLSNGLAESEGQLLGRDVAFVAEKEVYSSSFGRGDRVDDLQNGLFGPMAKETKQALSAGQTSSPWTSPLGGDEFVAVTAPLPMTPSTGVAYVVMANRSAALGLVSSTYIILVLTVLGLVGVGIYGFIIGGQFLRPLEKIEEGVLQVINGRTDLRIDVESPEFGGLAYRINQLINVFTGVAEEDEEGRVSQPPSGGGGGQAWQGSAFSEAGSGQQHAAGGAAAAEPIEDENLAAQLAAEPEEEYYQRVHGEYVEAKRSVGEDVSNIPQDRFIQRLKGNAQALAQKHGCRTVRFQVQTRGNQVVLRPVLIR